MHVFVLPFYIDNCMCLRLGAVLFTPVTGLDPWPAPFLLAFLPLTPSETFHFLWSVVYFSLQRHQQLGKKRRDKVCDNVIQQNPPNRPWFCRVYVDFLIRGVGINVRLIFKTTTLSKAYTSVNSAIAH